MNDNRSPPEAEVLVTKLLRATACIEAHLTDGLNAYLAKAGTTPQFAAMTAEFVKPLLHLLAEVEKDVIQFAHHWTASLAAPEVTETQVSSLESWADAIARLANTPQQMKAACGLKGCIQDMIRGKEVNRERRHEPERGR